MPKLRNIVGIAFVAMSLLTGVTTSGYYVRTGQSPSISDLADMLRHWPE